MSPVLNANTAREAGMPTVYILVGLPASGKSALAEKLKKETRGHTVIVAIHTLRKKCRNGTQNVFDEARQLIIKALQENHNVIFDATNIDGFRRGDLLKYIRRFGLAGKIISVFVDVPLRYCIARYRKRSAHAYGGQDPINRLKKMNKQLKQNRNHPLKRDLGQGFDEIHHYQSNGSGDHNSIRRVVLPPQSTRPVHKQGRKAA